MRSDLTAIFFIYSHYFIQLKFKIFINFNFVDNY